MANSESDKQHEIPYPGAFHPAAFYVPSAKHHQQVSTNVQVLEQKEVEYGDHSQGWMTLALVVLFLVLLVDWMWRNRH